LLGAVAALSSVYSRGSLEEKQHPARWEVSGAMVRRFEDLTSEFGGTRCIDIARVDWNDSSAVEAFRSSPDSRRAVCARLVGETAQALGEVIGQADSGSGGNVE